MSIFFPKKYKYLKWSTDFHSKQHLKPYCKSFSLKVINNRFEISALWIVFGQLKKLLFSYISTLWKDVEKILTIPWPFIQGWFSAPSKKNIPKLGLGFMTNSFSTFDIWQTIMKIFSMSIFERAPSRYNH